MTGTGGILWGRPTPLDRPGLKVMWFAHKRLRTEIHGNPLRFGLEFEAGHGVYEARLDVARWRLALVVIR